jgi:hypothetical protein
MVCSSGSSIKANNSTAPTADPFNANIQSIKVVGMQTDLCPSYCAVVGDNGTRKREFLIAYTTGKFPYEYVPTVPTLLSN